MKKTSEDILLKICLSNFSFVIKFSFKQTIDSKTLKCLNKKIMKYFIIYSLFDKQSEGIFIMDEMDNYLPMIYFEMDYKVFLKVIIRWSKISYRAIKSYTLVAMKKSLIINYLAKIESLEKNPEYKRASVKQLNGNALTFLERNKYKSFNSGFHWRVTNLIIKCHLKAISRCYLRSSLRMMDIY